MPRLSEYEAQALQKQGVGGLRLSENINELLE